MRKFVFIYIIPFLHPPTMLYPLIALVSYTLKRHRWMPELKEWVKVPKKKQKKKKKPSAPKKEEHKPTDDKGTEQVIVYEEVIVEV